MRLLASWALQCTGFVGSTTRTQRSEVAEAVRAADGATGQDRVRHVNSRVRLRAVMLPWRSAKEPRGVYCVAT
jgi:hypothetical protein